MITAGVFQAKGRDSQIHPAPKYGRPTHQVRYSSQAQLTFNVFLKLHLTCIFYHNVQILLCSFCARTEIIFKDTCRKF
jgi:hypothetical protein